MKPVLALILLLAWLVPANPLAAQVVTDSVRMTRKVYHWWNTDANGYSCGAYVYATWPDVRADVGLPGGYTMYNRVATGGTRATGHYVPYGYGEAKHDPSRNLIVPEGYLAHAPQLGGHGWGGGTGGVGCTNAFAGAQSSVPNGPMRVLNAAPFQITDWYALFTIPSGTPIALFLWEQRRGLDVAFDGSFESQQSREADATAPGKKRPVASYAWDFGDGRTGSGARPTHTYDSTGTYTVVLTVTDDDGETAKRTETIEVKGGILSVRSRVEQTELTVGDTVTVVAIVANTGTETLEDISAERAFTHHSLYPSAANAPGDRFQAANLERVGEESPVTFATLAPADTFEVRARYLVKALATYRPNGATVYKPVKAEIRSWLTNVTAKTPDGESVRVVNECEESDCDNVWEVIPSWHARVEYRTDNMVTFQAKAGVEFNPVLLAPELQGFNFPPVQPFTYAFVDDELKRFCHTACVDIRVVVTDTLKGEPVEGATVVLQAPAIPASANVTPDHSGGHFCYRGTLRNICDKTVTLQTDEEGVVEAYYSFPGIVEPVEVAVKVQAKDGSALMAEEAPPLRLLPNERTDFQREIVVDDAEQVFLNTTEVAYTSGFYYNSTGEFCEGLGKGSLANTLSYVVRPGTTSLPYRAANSLIEWACTLNPLTLLGQETGGNAKKVAEIALVTWFGSRFIPPEAGLGILSGPFPPPFVLYFEGDYYAAVIESALEAASPGAVGGGRAKLSLYEVSWLQQESVLDANPFVPNAYFKFEYEPDNGSAREVEALIELGYDPGIWLSMPPSEVLAELAEAEATRIRVQETIDRIMRGDYLWLTDSAGNTEMAQVADVEEGLGKEGSVYTVHLTRPLRHAYGPGSTVYVQRDSADVTPPTRPILLTRDSVAVASPLTLWWAMGLFETPHTFEVQVARDTTFSDLVRSETGLLEPVLAYGSIADGEVLYWRARALNLVGAGEWARYVQVVGSDAITTGVGAPEVPSALALGRPYPNPSQGRVSVPFELPAPSAVRITVHDALGREVAVLVEEVRAPGRHVESLAPGALSAGVYFVRLVTDDGVQTRPLVVVR